MKTGVVFDEEMVMHKFHSGFHPERPERIMLIWAHLFESGLLEDVVRVESREATDEEILDCHSSEHLHTIDKFRELEP